VHELREPGVHAEGSKGLVLDETLVAAPPLGWGVAAALSSSVARSARILSRRASFLRRSRLYRDLSPLISPIVGLSFSRQVNRACRGNSAAGAIAPVLVTALNGDRSPVPSTGDLQSSSEAPRIESPTLLTAATLLVRNRPCLCRVDDSAAPVSHAARALFRSGNFSRKCE
jgi:hypothetical protein